jgi:hypothetical protein
VSGDVRLVQRGSVDHSAHTFHASFHKMSIYDRSDLARKFRRNNVCPYDFPVLVPQSPDQRLAQMTTATGNQNPHADLFNCQIRRIRRNTIRRQRDRGLTLPGQRPRQRTQVDLVLAHVCSLCACKQHRNRRASHRCRYT